MTDAQKKIWASIRAELKDLPEESVLRALDYYEEYFADAAEAGRSEAETLKRLGGVKEIAAQARAEAILAGAERRPGPFRLIGAARQALRGLAGSAAKASIVIGAAIPYTLALACYLFAAACFIGAPAALGLAGFGMAAMPRADGLSLFGMAALGLGLAALSAGCGLAFWAAGKAITRVTLRALKRGLRRDREPKREPERVKALGGAKLRIALIVCAALALAGLTGAGLTGLPVKYFTIWLSRKPENLQTRTWEFPVGKVRELELSTMNSSIRMEAGAVSGGVIRVTYEEPEWLTGEPAVGGRKLTFREIPSGVLPFMDFITRHEGTTALTIVIPRGFRPASVAVESKSGDVSLAAAADDLRVKTDSGDVLYRGIGPYRIRIGAPRGRIIVKGEEKKGGLFEAGSAGAAVEIKTWDGTVEVK